MTSTLDYCSWDELEIREKVQGTHGRVRFSRTLTNSSGHTLIASTAPAIHPDVRDTTGFELFLDIVTAATARTIAATRSFWSAAIALWKKCKYINVGRKEHGDVNTWDRDGLGFRRRCRLEELVYFVQ